MAGDLSRGSAARRPACDGGNAAAGGMKVYSLCRINKRAFTTKLYREDSFVYMKEHSFQ